MESQVLPPSYTRFQNKYCNSMYEYIRKLDDICVIFCISFMFIGSFVIFISVNIITNP